MGGRPSVDVERITSALQRWRGRDEMVLVLDPQVRQDIQALLEYIDILESRIRRLELSMLLLFNSGEA